MMSWRKILKVARVDSISLDSVTHHVQDNVRSQTNVSPVVSIVQLASVEISCWPISNFWMHSTRKYVTVIGQLMKLLQKEL